MSTLMIVKVLGIIGFVAAIVWWQFRDLVQQKKARSAASGST